MTDETEATAFDKLFVAQQVVEDISEEIFNKSKLILPDTLRTGVTWQDERFQKWSYRPCTNKESKHRNSNRSRKWHDPNTSWWIIITAKNGNQKHIQSHMFTLYRCEHHAIMLVESTSRNRILVVLSSNLEIKDE